MDGSGEFQDWEMLPNSDLSPVSGTDFAENCRDLGVIDGDSEGMIRADYFASDSARRHGKVVTDLEENSAQGLSDPDSNAPNWVDPCLDAGFGEKMEVGFEETELECKNSASSIEVNAVFLLDSGEFDGNSVEVQAQTELGSDKFLETKVGDGSDSGVSGGSSPLAERGNRSDSGDFLEDGSDSGGVVEAEGEGLNSGSVAANVSGETESGEGANRRMVWWKLPLELLKFCAFKVSPVWSFSIAAAVMGFVILGRKLYKIRRKTRTFPLKVSVEDKCDFSDLFNLLFWAGAHHYWIMSLGYVFLLQKVSQFMIQAARLNEAFSVVRRVPVIRSTLPAAGLTPWPVMGLS